MSNASEAAPPAFSEAASFISDKGLEQNGSVLLYYGVHEERGTPYELKSIAWRLLEDVGVAIAAYNTPKSLHCLSPNQQAETFVVLEHAKRDPRVKVLVWTATGTKSFCSGMALRGDLDVYVPAEAIASYEAREMAPGPKGDFVLTRQTKAFWDFPKPLILAINGLAVGGGANIALANFGDMVLCSKKARFMYPFAKLGFTPELGSSMVMPFLVGLAKTKELMMTGTWLSAEDALRLNLINAIYSEEELLPKALALAAKIAANHPENMRLMKQVLNHPLREKLNEVLARENATIVKSIGSFSGGPLKSSL